MLYRLIERFVTCICAGVKEQQKQTALLKEILVALTPPSNEFMNKLDSLITELEVLGK